MSNLCEHGLLTEASESDLVGMRLGQVTHISSDGEISVDFPGNPAAPVEARLLSNVCHDLQVDDTVMLVFESADRLRPIVVGSVASRLPTKPIEKSPQQTVEVVAPEVQKAKKEASIDGRKITLNGRDEVVLRCGKSSITLKKDGKILIKGTHVVSQATRSNKIKGGSVAIN